MIYLSNVSVNGSIDTPAVAQSSDSASRMEMANNIAPKKLKEIDDANNYEDQEAMELFSRVRSKENEIMNLREQIALASIKLLNEKHLMERKFSELRLALDDKQNEAITSASNELARRKGDLEENLRLINELKIAEDERCIFMSSMIGLLGEYGIWPRVTNAFALTNSIKHLHDQLQMKIKSSHDRIEELNVMAGNQAGNAYHSMDNHSPGDSIGEFPSSSMGVGGTSVRKHYVDGHHIEPADMPRYMQDNDNQRTGSLMLKHETLRSSAVNNPKPSAESDKSFASSEVYDIFDRSGLQMRSEDTMNDQLYNSQLSNDRNGSLTSEGEGPGIDGFQIIGDAKPGGKLLGCGFCVRGTSLCMFQWVRHYPDGTRQYIEGATNPEYVVTADDVDKFIAVECIPMDDHGHQGDLVRLFANDQNKITCDPDMQLEIDTHSSNGHATFDVLMLPSTLKQEDSSETWELTTLFLRKYSFQVKVHRTQAVVIAEKFSRDLSVKVPNGLSSQLVLTCSDGSSHFFSTNNDVRMRDTLVLTLRLFQHKALDEKRKGRA